MRPSQTPSEKFVPEEVATWHMYRFVRKTLSFSKSRQMHHCCLKLFIYRYNLERRSIILE